MPLLNTDFTVTIQSLYLAYYGRGADPAGLAFWEDYLEGRNLDTVINYFGNSQEYTDRYGGLSNADLVNGLYQQSFGRDAEPGGLAYYVGRLVDGSSTLVEIAVDILAGAQGDDLVVLNTRLEFSDTFTGEVAARESVEGIFYSSGEDIKLVTQFFAGIDDTIPTNDELNELLISIGAAGPDVIPPDTNIPPDADTGSDTDTPPDTEPSPDTDVPPNIWLPLVAITSTDTLIADSTPTITGTADAGSVVTLKLDGVAIGDAITPTAEGTWSATLSTLTDNTYSLVATATYLSSSSAITAPYTFTIDATPPEISYNWNSETSIFTVSATDASGITGVSVSGDESFYTINNNVIAFDFTDKGAWIGNKGSIFNAGLYEFGFVDTYLNTATSSYVIQISSLGWFVGDSDPEIFLLKSPRNAHDLFTGGDGRNDDGTNDKPDLVFTPSADPKSISLWIMPTLGTHIEGVNNDVWVFISLNVFSVPYYATGTIAEPGGITTFTLFDPATNAAVGVITGTYIRGIATGHSSGSIIYGNSEANVFSSYGGEDTFYGAGGNDSFQGSRSSSTAYGGDGSDWYDFRWDTEYGSLIIDLGTTIGGFAHGYHMADGVRNTDSALNIDYLNSIENIIGSVLSDVIIGDNEDNILVGVRGADTLKGGGGNDFLIVGDNTFAVIDGGPGEDILWFNYWDETNSARRIDFSALAGTVTNIEGISLAGRLQDTVLRLDSTWVLRWDLNREVKSALTLSYEDILSMTDDRNQLTVYGDKGDKVVLEGEWLSVGGTYTSTGDDSVEVVVILSGDITGEFI